ncbi:MAG TPA: DinB family protein [Vicinamibacterales bacterium]|nr:DinB family protein [Vicinamibacterales bacterium]
MKSMKGLFSIAAMAMVVLAQAVPSGEEISKADRDKVVQYLTTTRDQVIAETERLSDAQWNFKAGPDRWSVGEVVEHLALAEDFLAGALKQTMAGPAPTAEQVAAAKGKEALILKAIPDRTQKVQAPEPLQPKQRLGSRASVMAAFKDRRAQTLDYAQKTTDDLRSRIGDSPLGPMDAYQWLLFVPAHTERHLGQIREAKAHPNFPKS